MGDVENSKLLSTKMLYDSIRRSAVIEGFSTTSHATECILNNIPVETTYAEASFIVGMDKGWEYILSNLGTPNDLLFLRNLHDITCHNIVRYPGCLRTDNVKIGDCSYLPSIPDINKCYEDLNEISLIEDATKKAAIMFGYLTRGQLFWDGNKRMAQLMTNKILIENNIGILRIDISNLNEFNSVLIDWYLTNNGAKLFKYVYSHIEAIDL